MPQSIRKSLVIIGDFGCGKTSLLHRFYADSFPVPMYCPIVYETHVVDVVVADHKMELALYDTSECDSYDALRLFAYAKSDVILICFAIDFPDSLYNIEEKWVPEVRHFCPNVPIILVGCKKDLRCDQETTNYLRNMEQRRPITFEEGMSVATQIGACKYMECSAKTYQGVHEVLNHAARITLDRDTPKLCIIL